MDCSSTVDPTIDEILFTKGSKSTIGGVIEDDQFILDSLTKNELKIQKKQGKSKIQQTENLKFPKQQKNNLKTPIENKSEKVTDIKILEKKDMKSKVPTFPCMYYACRIKCYNPNHDHTIDIHSVISSYLNIGKNCNDGKNCPSFQHKKIKTPFGEITTCNFSHHEHEHLIKNQIGKKWREFKEGKISLELVKNPNYFPDSQLLNQKLKK